MHSVPSKEFARRHVRPLCVGKGLVRTERGSRHPQEYWREASEETKPASNLTLDFLVFRVSVSTFPLVKPCLLWSLQVQQP